MGCWNGCADGNECVDVGVGCSGIASDIGRAKRETWGRLLELPRNLENTLVEMTELLEERGAHIYSVSASEGIRDPQVRYAPMSFAPQPGHASRTVAVAVLPLAVFLIFTFCSRKH